MPAPVVSVKFDQHDQRIYYSGDTLSGRVEISCSKAKLIRSISIQIVGYAKTFWDKPIFYSWKLNCIKKENSTYYDHSGREEYIAKHAYLLGSQDATSVELSPGVHKYEFSFDLPSSLPSSFEGSHGYVRYMAKVAIDRPSTSIHTIIEQFTVHKKFDLNTDSPVLKLRADVETVYESGCFCCLSKPFRLKASVPQTGVVPGQMIPVRAEVNNVSNLNVLDVRFFIRKIITYKSSKPTDERTKQEIIELVSVSSAYMVRKGCNKFEEFLAVPKTQSTNIESQWGIIQIEYDIKVQAFLRKWRKSPFVICPITVGTVALQNVVKNEKDDNSEAHELQPLKWKAFGEDVDDDVFIEYIDD